MFEVRHIQQIGTSRADPANGARFYMSVGVTLNHLDVMCWGYVEGGDGRFDSCVRPTLPVAI